MMRDTDFGIVRIRAFGTFDFHIVKPDVFLKEVAGSDQHFRLDEFSDTMRSRIVSLFSEAIAKAKIPVLDVAARYSEVGAAILPVLNEATIAKYGIEFSSFILENVSVPPEVEAAIDKRSSMAAVGNLNDYVKFQMAEGMGKGGGPGVGGAAAEMAMGFAMAQNMMNQPGGIAGSQATLGISGPPPAGAPVGAPPAVPGTAAPELLTPAQVAQQLGVTEADVMSSLDSGDLKGKKIGTAWRITKTALNEFLAK
jgi:excisionase family DNA binding protein